MESRRTLIWIKRLSASPVLVALVGVVVKQNTVGRPVEIIELTGFQRPQKSSKTDQPEKQGGWDEIDQRGHGLAPRSPKRRRKALSVTAIDDADMATAAISGVTNPAIAKGIAMAL